MTAKSKTPGKKFDPKQAQETLAAAKSRGKLSLDEMDKILPEDAGADEIDRVMLSLCQADVDLEEPAAPAPAAPAAGGNGKAAAKEPPKKDPAAQARLMEPQLHAVAGVQAHAQYRQVHPVKKHFQVVTA